ncbi:MAG: 6-phospho-3-hexuloisomerase [Desulfitobacteriaceae bacterium]|nr:6-phospho-3-hexuloisomerase [Desulfitobacteriaceae bacterium]MDI6914030.1 6-phospho-3-hexuloisomerase [Desulfitobacteriaceae bacterium]
MSTLKSILAEIEFVLGQVEENRLYSVLKHFSRGSRIFIDGEGRSGLMGKAFAMRLMHIGYQVYVVGETITPALQAGDLYVAISGSGETKFVVAKTEKAKAAGCRIIAVTSKKGSSLVRLADETIMVPGATKGDQGEERKSVQLLGSLFDQSVHIVLDSLCLLLSQRDQVSQAMAVERHSVLE